MNFIEVTEESMKDLIINNMDGFDENNTAVTDERVFAYSQTTSGVDKCCIIEYSGVVETGKSEFVSSMLATKVIVNGFFRVNGSTDLMRAINDGKRFTEELVTLVTRNPRLGSSSVMGAKFEDTIGLIEYQRTDRYIYMMAPLTFVVFQNIS